MKLKATYITSLTFWPFVLLFTLLSFLASLIPWCFFALAHLNFNDTSDPSVKHYGIFRIVIEGIIIAPIIETFLFQKIFFDFFDGKIKIRFIILISALCFGLSHFYNLGYIINTFFMGVILATAYTIWSDKKISPFWTVVTIHLLHNLIVFLIQIST